MEIIGSIILVIVILLLMGAIYTGVSNDVNTMIYGRGWDDPDYKEEIVIRHEYPEQNISYSCSDCDGELSGLGLSFCPHCGGKLEGEIYE
jgi:hypothetical protein